MAVTVAANDDDQPTVGKFVGIVSGRALIVGLISEVNEEVDGNQSGRTSRSVAQLELIGEIGVHQNGAARFATRSK